MLASIFILDMGVASSSPRAHSRYRVHKRSLKLQDKLWKREITADVRNAETSQARTTKVLAKICLKGYFWNSPSRRKLKIGRKFGRKYRSRYQSEVDDRQQLRAS